MSNSRKLVQSSSLPDANVEQSRKNTHEESENSANTTVANIDKVYKEKLLRSHEYMKAYEKQGYVVLREKLVEADLMPQAATVNEYVSEDKIPMGEKTGIQLLTKDKNIFMVTNRNMLNAKELPEPVMVRNSLARDIHPKLIKHAFMIVKKINIEGNLVYELRVTSAGHAYLIKDEEKDSIVCAGEIYTFDEHLLFANDQTGHFYIILQPYKSEYLAIFEMFFPKDLGYQFSEVPTGKSGQELAVIMANHIIDTLQINGISVDDKIVDQYRDALSKYELQRGAPVAEMIDRPENAMDVDINDNNNNMSNKAEKVVVNRVSNYSGTMFSPAHATDQKSTEVGLTRDTPDADQALNM